MANTADAARTIEPAMTHTATRPKRGRQPAAIAPNSAATTAVTTVALLAPTASSMATVPTDTAAAARTCGRRGRPSSVHNIATPMRAGTSTVAR